MMEMIRWPERFAEETGRLRKRFQGGRKHGGSTARPGVTCHYVALRRRWGRSALLILLCCMPLAGCASGPSWKEEVITFSGERMVVERQVIEGALLDQQPSNIRFGPPIKGNVLRAPLPGGSWTTKWEALGLDPQAIGRVGGSMYLSATPMLCGDYDKWGRPVPPYVFFRYVGTEWQRIPVEDFPAAISKRNLTYAGSQPHREAVSTGFISAEQGKLLNPGLAPNVQSVQRSGHLGFERCRQRLEALDAQRKPAATMEK